MAFKVGSQTVIDISVATGETQLESAAGKNIALAPDQHTRFTEGCALIFEGATADDFETTLTVADPTADRTLTLPDSTGTLATQAYVTSAVTGGALSDTDDLTEGTTNLYYTDARADARVDAGFTAKSTTDLSEGTNLYYTAARDTAQFNTDLATKTTDNLTEGSTNLYYTDARVDARIAGNTGGSLDLSGKTTDDLTEGTTNLYFTNARIDDYVEGGNGIAYGSGTIDVDNTVVRTSTAQSIAGVKTFSDNVIISGDLTVNGTTTTINTNELAIGDNIITLNSDETGAPSQNAGIEVERGTSTNVAIRWNESTDQWEFSNDGTTYVAFGTSATFTGTTDGVNEGTTNLYYTDARADARATLRINAATTDNISEGSTNLYYTNTRARTEIEGADLDLAGNKVLFANKYDNLVDLPSATTYHGMFAHVHGTGKGYFAHGGAWRVLLDETSSTTDNISEGSTNLYYTDARAQAVSINNVVEDTSPQLGGALNANSFDIDMGTNVITDAKVGQWDTAYGWGNHASAGYITSAGTATNFSSTTQNSQFNSIGVGTAASTTAGEIRATNDVTAYYSSDANLKTNVVNIENALDKVKQIRGVEFDWTQEYIDDKGGEDGYFVRKHDVGVIAQEVEAVLPEVVGTRENGTKAVRYDRIVALLIEAIKDQQSQIDELKQIITDIGNK